MFAASPLPLAELVHSDSLLERGGAGVDGTVVARRRMQRVVKECLGELVAQAEAAATTLHNPWTDLSPPAATAAKLRAELAVRCPSPRGSTHRRTILRCGNAAPLSRGRKLLDATPWHERQFAFSRLPNCRDVIQWAHSMAQEIPKNSAAP